MFCIVVARYHENIEWTKSFYPVVIYNKGIPLYVDNEVRLKNVGREGHTYYQYICDNYEKLSEYTIFLQGNPFDHSPNLLSQLHQLSGEHFEFLSERIHHSSLEVERITHWQCKDIHTTWSRVFGVHDMNQECIFGEGAQFVVSKHAILRRPKEFYENIVSILEYSLDPPEGYDIERFHKYIFS